MYFGYFGLFLMVLLKIVVESYNSCKLCESVCGVMYKGYENVYVCEFGKVM